MTDDDKLNMKYKAEKCFKVLGFTKNENVRDLKIHWLKMDGKCKRLKDTLVKNGWKM